MSIKKKIVILLGCFAITCTAGCMRLSFTPVVTSPKDLVPSELVKTVLLGESCGSIGYFGGSGDASLGAFLKQKKATKITYVDYDVRLGIFGGNVCMRIYGY